MEQENDRMKKLREILKENQAQTIDGFLVDSFTASMLCQIYNALSPSNRLSFSTLPLTKMVDIGWKLVSKNKK